MGLSQEGSCMRGKEWALCPSQGAGQGRNLIRLAFQKDLDRLTGRDTRDRGELEYFWSAKCFRIIR